MSEAAIAPNIPWEVIAALAQLNPKQFAVSCSAFAALLNITPKALRAAVLKMQAEGQDDLPYRVHLPWGTPVDLAMLLTEIAQFLRRHIIMSTAQADAMTLWVANTYVFETAEHAPLLIVNAPERSCGKTLVLDIVTSLASRAVSAGLISSSALFRTVEALRPTLAIDEADTFVGRNLDMHGLLNVGYKRGAPVMRVEKTASGAFERKSFDVFCPKVIAGIALERHLPDATMSRGIPINMSRKLPEQKVERWRYVDRAEVDRLARSLARVAEDCADAIVQARPTLPDELADRDQDNWQPLFAIAEVAGADWTERALVAARELSGKEAQPESISHELLHDIRDILEEYERSLEKRADANKPRKYIRSSDLLDALHGLEDSSWDEYYRGEPISAKQLAKQLAPYGLRPKTVRIKDGDTPKGYEIRNFKEAFSRYLKDKHVVDDETAGEADAPVPDAPFVPPQRPQEPPQLDAPY